MSTAYVELLKRLKDVVPTKTRLTEALEAERQALESRAAKRAGEVSQATPKPPTP